MARTAGGYFRDADEYKSALRSYVGMGLLELRTADGLTITIRRNFGDASVLAEVFLEDCYIQDLALSPNPVIVDVGGFIGDFALYAVKRLNARRVIVYEPAPKNWALLIKNIAQNGYEDRIEAVNKAVTDGGDVMLNIDAPNEHTWIVSAYDPTDEPLSPVPGISLRELLRDHAVESVDLLKMDCEGAEYAIIESTPTDIFSRIRNIVFEYHQFPGFQPKLSSARQRLRREGYALRARGSLIWACRP